MPYTKIRSGGTFMETFGRINDNFDNTLGKDNSAVYSPSSDYNPATKKYVDDKLNQILDREDVFRIKGTLAGGSGAIGTFTPAADAGHIYPVSAAGVINGENVKAGDILICLHDSTAASDVNNYETVKESWNILHTSGTGLWEAGTGLHAIKSPGATAASGNYSHAEGLSTRAVQSQAHAEGESTNAGGTDSHAEGNGTTASGSASHSEGNGTTASGENSHAEGLQSTASGAEAHAEGSHTSASGSGSHAEGSGTSANHKSQHVFGEYNTADASPALPTARGNYVEIVGNGSSLARSNARTLDWNGNEWISGNLTVEGTPSDNKHVITKKYFEDHKGSDAPEIYRLTLLAEGWNNGEYEYRNPVFVEDGYLYTPYGSQYSQTDISLTVEDGIATFSAAAVPAGNITVFIKKEAIDYKGDLQNIPEEPEEPAGE